MGHPFVSNGVFADTFNGEIIFYGGEGDEWHEYAATFIDGRLTDLRKREWLKKEVVRDHSDNVMTSEILEANRAALKVPIAKWMRQREREVR